MHPVYVYDIMIGALIIVGLTVFINRWFVQQFKERRHKRSDKH